MITKEQAERTFYARHGDAWVWEVRDLQLQQIDSSQIVSEDIAAFDVEAVAWECSYEQRFKELQRGEWTGRYGGWLKRIEYVVELKPGPYLVSRN